MLRKYWSITLVVLFLAVTLGYLWIVGDRVYIQVHDNLDSNIAWLKMMTDNGLFWSIDTSVPFLGGLNRDYMYSDLKVYSWLYMFFPTLVAFVTGWYLRIFLSIVGFVALGREIYGNQKNLNYFIVCGLMYGILPIFPTCGLSFASLPLFFCIILKTYRQFRYIYLLFFFFYPFVSDFALFGMFMCMGLFGLFLAYSWRHKKFGWRFLFACSILAIGFIVTEWRLFYVMLFLHEESIRNTFIIEYVNIFGAIKEIIKVFLIGQYHSGSSHILVVLPVVAYGWYYLHQNNGEDINVSFSRKLFKWTIVAQIVCCVMYGVDRMEWFREAIGIIIPILKGFQWGRTLWFAPFLWYLSFMLAICEINWKQQRKHLAILLAIIYICICPSIYNDIFTNSKNQIKIFMGKQVNELNYREFYAVDLFDEIKQKIDYNGEWSVAYGFHPAVLEYNGIATLDGYLSFYGKSYKDKFRQLIAPELNIDEKSRKYFDNWGGRAYIFSTEVGYAPEKNIHIKQSTMHIDMNVFRKMGGEYVFSRVEISNAEELGLTMLEQFSNDNTPYTIFVYKY